MKKIIILALAILIIVSCAFCGSKKNKPLQDGFYLVEQNGFDTTNFGNISTDQAVIGFDTEFLMNNPQEFSKIKIDISEFVPLELEKLPEAQQQTELKKLLLISLTPEATEKVKLFTSKNVMHSIAIVLKGKAITMHKIKEAITDGKIQITRCDDNACEYLYVRMKDNVKK